MKKSDRKRFEALCQEVFGNKKAYKILLKKGFHYIDQRTNIVKVQRFTEAQLWATLVEAAQKKQEAAKEQAEASKTETPEVAHAQDAVTPTGD